MRLLPSKLVLVTAVLLPLATAHGDDPRGGHPRGGHPPQLKEGMWEVHMQSEERPSGNKTDVIYRLCRDHAYDKTADEMLKNLAGCTTVIKDAGDGKFSSASNCVVNGITVISSGFTTFASKTATHSETEAKYSPPIAGKTDETMTQDQHYLGKCPAGVKPGDTIGPDGFIRHHEH